MSYTKREVRKPLLLLAALSAAFAQSPAFEVVSIKLAPEGSGSTVSSRGGPGTRTPTIWTCEHMSLSNIVWIGFNLQSQQLVHPEWMAEPRFDITAKVPEGATREQFYQMFQNMLVERFGLRFHRGEKEVQGYELTVAKGGPKFQQSGPEPPMSGSTQPVPRPSRGADGYPVMPEGVTYTAMMGNRARGQWLQYTMQRFAKALDDNVGKPVVDATGLTGKYDLRLFWIPDTMREEAAGPNIFAALQEQLGLKLEAKKVMLPLVIIDHAEKLPTEN